MSGYFLTEEQALQVEKARLALSAVSTLVDEAREFQPAPAELAALLCLVVEALPTGLAFTASGPIAA